VRTGIIQVASSARGWIPKAGNDGFIKLAADAGRGVLIGATSAGPIGGAVLGALVVPDADQLPGVHSRTLASLAQMIIRMAGAGHNLSQELDTWS